MAFEQALISDQELLEQFGIDPQTAVVALIDAHPDDTEAGKGGLARVFVRNGVRVIQNTLTLGEESTLGDPAVVRNGGRSTEALNAAEVTGIQPEDIHLGAYPDIDTPLPDSRLSHYPNMNKLLRSITALVMNKHVTHLFAGGLERFEPRPHPDHAAVSRAARTVARYLPLLKHSMALWELTPDGDVVVPVDPDEKFEQLAPHKTQIDLDVLKGGGVLFAGREIPPATAEQMAPYEKLFYAEPYSLHLPGPPRDDTRAARLVVAAGAQHSR